MKNSETKKKATPKAAVKKTTVKKVSAKKVEIKKESAVKTDKTENIKKCPFVCDDAVVDSFIQEVTDDVKNDNLKAFWNKYGLFVVLFVLLAVSAAVGFETIKNWRAQKFQLRNEQYFMAVQPKENYQDTIKALEKVANGKSGIYSEMARVQIANILLEQNKADEAEAMLQAIIKNENLSIRTRHLAALKLATYKIDTAPTAEIESLLNPIVEADNSWSPLAQEFLAITAFRDGDIEKSKRIYTSLLESAKLSESFKARIQDMMSVLNEI